MRIRRSQALRGRSPRVGKVEKVSVSFPALALQAFKHRQFIARFRHPAVPGSDLIFHAA